MRIYGFPLVVIIICASVAYIDFRLRITKGYSSSQNTEVNMPVTAASNEPTEDLKKSRTKENENVFDYNYFVIKNPPTSIDAGIFAKKLFMDGHLHDSIKYAKEVLIRNENINAVVDSIPVLLSAYKTNGKQYSFVQDISDAVMYLNQIDPDGNKPEIENIVFNALNLITTTNKFNLHEQRYLLQQFQSHLEVIPYARNQVSDFEEILDSAAKNEEMYLDDKNFIYTGGLLVAPPL